MNLTVRILILLVFGGFGLVMLWVGATQCVRQRRLLTHATAVEAEIIEARVQSSTSSNTDRRPLRSTSTTTHSPVVRFRYRVGDAEYVSDMLRPTSIGTSYASRESAEEEIAAYRPGARIIAFVDPALPGAGFLVAERSSGPLVFIIVGLLLPPVAWAAGTLV
jgi:hypothetical protein